MLPKDKAVRYAIYTGGALALALELPTLRMAYHTLGRDVEYAYKVGSALKNCEAFVKKNMTIHQKFYDTCSKHPDKVMVYYRDEEWTYRDMEMYSNQVGHYLASLRYERGDVIAVMMENKPQFIGVLLGCSKLGLTAALINTNLAQDSLLHCITVAKAKGMIFDHSLGQPVADIIHKLQEQLPAFISLSIDNPDRFSATPIPFYFSGLKDLDAGVRGMSRKPLPPNIRNGAKSTDTLCYVYTSGTTGLPKPAYQDHARMYMGSNMAVYPIGLKKTDIIYCTLPLYHSSALWMAAGSAINIGCSVILRPKFSASAFWKDCVRYKATCAQYIGEICRFLLQTPPCPEEKKHRLRMMYGVGLRPQIWKQFVARFQVPTIREMFGSTEGTYGSVNIRNQPGAVGFLPRLINYNPFALIKVDKVSGSVMRGKNGLCITCGPGEEGEMVGLVRQSDRGGPDKFKAYVNQKDDPNQGRIIRDVWRKGDMCFRSGDILVMDEFGWLYFQDRKGDTFRWRGENVATLEVEAVISNILGHTSALVYGVEVPGAEGRAGMVAILGTVDLQKLAEGVKKALPHYARPMFVRIIKDLPLTGTYKLKKTELQKEGFDVTRLEDPVYFMGPREKQYRILDKEAYDNLQANLNSSKL